MRRVGGVDPDPVAGQHRHAEPGHGHELDGNDPDGPGPPGPDERRQGEEDADDDVENGVEPGAAHPDEPEWAPSGESQESEDGSRGEKESVATDVHRHHHERDGEEVLEKLVDAEADRLSTTPGADRRARSRRRNGCLTL